MSNVKSLFRRLRNIRYRLKGIIEIYETHDKIYYKCIKCSSELIGHKQYGKLHIVCKCGHSAVVYTGENIHFSSATQAPKKEASAIKQEGDDKLCVFEKHIKSDLIYLYGSISDKRDIRIQASYEYCNNLSSVSDYKEGYTNIAKYLQDFCGLNSVSLNIVWEPLLNTETLSTRSDKVRVLGTTYPLKLGSLYFYTVYLNPDFRSDQKKIIATIAHELSHIYAFHNDLHFKSPDTDRANNEYNEQMTDLMGIVLGMGELISDSQYGTENIDTGYLTDEMIYKAYVLWKSEFLTGQINGIKTLIICSNCSQKVRVPLSKEKRKLKCPKCKKYI
jgi:DNA-directed RNA polymerase subunit RPC12/RpoP